MSLCEEQVDFLVHKKKKIPKIGNGLNYQPNETITFIGSVAAGKTSFSKVLSGADTRRSCAEQKDFRSRRLGYASFKIFKCVNMVSTKCIDNYENYPSSRMSAPSCTECKTKMQLVRHFSILDSPGHHQMMTEMVSGASCTDIAIITIAADEYAAGESFPNEQTLEHVSIAETMGTTHRSIILLNKLDAKDCLPIASILHSKVKEFFKGSGAETSPIIPISAALQFNIKHFCQALAKVNPNTIIDNANTLPIKFMIVRSFDVNKPGCTIKDLTGGVIGGTLMQGVLSNGDRVQIRPGLVIADGSYIPIDATVKSIHAGEQQLDKAFPGGMVAISLDIDPMLTKANRLVGQIICGASDTPCSNLVRLKYFLVQNKVKPKKPKVNEIILVCIGSGKSEAKVISVDTGWQMQIQLSVTCCPTYGEKVAIFRNSPSKTKTTSKAGLLDTNSKVNWRLLASGSVLNFIPSKISNIASLSKSKVDSLHSSFDKVKKLPSDIIFDALHHDDTTSPLYNPDLPWEMYVDVIGNDCTTENKYEVKTTEATEVTEGKKFNKQFIYGKSLPKVDDFVLIRPIRFQAGAGAYCELIGYGGSVEAFLLEAEFKHRQMNKITCAMVTRVDTKKKQVDVSKRRVQAKDRKEIDLEFEDCKVLYSLLFQISHTTGYTMPTLYNHLLYIYGNHKEWLSCIKTWRNKLDDSSIIQKAVCEAIEKIIIVPVKKVIANVEIDCFYTGGIELIKAKLSNFIEVYPLVEIQFVSSPLFTVSFSHKQLEVAMEEVKKACKTLFDDIESIGGSFLVKDINVIE